MSLLAQHGLMLAPAGGGGAGDPHWANVVSLLHFDGADGATSFTDEKGVSWSASGNAQISTTSPEYGSGCLLSDGTGDWIEATNPAFNLSSTTELTIEFSIRPTALSGVRMCFELYIPASNTLRFYLFGSGFTVERSSSSLISVASGVFVAGVYTKVALVLSAGVFKVYINGVQSGPNGNLFGSLGSGTTLRLMNDRGNNFSMNGRMDEFRFTKGVARYTSSYTPETGPFAGG